MSEKLQLFLLILSLPVFIVFSYGIRSFVLHSKKLKAKEDLFKIRGYKRSDSDKLQLFQSEHFGDFLHSVLGSKNSSFTKTNVIFIEHLKYTIYAYGLFPARHSPCYILSVVFKQADLNESSAKPTSIASHLKKLQSTHPLFDLFDKLSKISYSVRASEAFWNQKVLHLILDPNIGNYFEKEDLIIQELFRR